MRITHQHGRLNLQAEAVELDDVAVEADALEDADLLLQRRQQHIVRKGGQLLDGHLVVAPPFALEHLSMSSSSWLLLASAGQEGGLPLSTTKPPMQARWSEHTCHERCPGLTRHC